MAYNSTHTGAKIDEAVTYILETLKPLFNINTTAYTDCVLTVTENGIKWVGVTNAEEVSF